VSSAEEKKWISIHGADAAPMKDESNLRPRPRSFPIIADSSPPAHTHARADAPRSKVKQLISEAPLRRFAFSLADSFRVSPELTPP